MTIIISIGVFILLLIIGYLVNRSELKSMSLVYDFVSEFYDKFLNFAFITKDKTPVEDIVDSTHKCNFDGRKR